MFTGSNYRLKLIRQESANFIITSFNGLLSLEVSSLKIEPTFSFGANI
jgi:hypothetical protein